MERGGGSSQVVGDYIVGPQKIGSGSFSVVWKGRHRQHGLEVAVKEIDQRKLNTKVKESLLKEISILHHVSHPNIVKLHEAIQTEDKIYLILEYCTGGDLAAYIDRHGRVSESVAGHFMRQLASGLQVLRENNLIHRDLKPQNLLLCTKDETPQLKIGDFGFARYLMPQGLADTLCGSPLYMAPEIIQNKKYDAKADLWSVGAILFQLVTGKPPFDGNTQFQLFQNVLASDELQFPQDAMTSLHPDCINLCRSLLRRNPVERLAFVDFFNHKFMALRRPIESALEDTHDTADDSFGKEFCDSSVSACVPNIKNGAMEQGFFKASTAKAADSFASIEQEYVIVHPHFASMETLSSLLESSLGGNSTTKVLSYRQKNTGICSSSFMQTGKLVSAFCSAKGMDSQVSAYLSELRVSTASAIVPRASIFEPSSRLSFLIQYIYALSELAREKLYADLPLESFSVELIALAVWKEALRVCNCWMSSTIVAESVGECSSQKEEYYLPHNLAAGLDLTKPFSICSWVEKGFIHACSRAEKISDGFLDIDGNLEMPDAMELIFQTAISAGKSGAVDELLGHLSGAIALYSKAITLFTFILVEAPSLLTPPFLLSPDDRQRICRYIINLRGHLNQLQTVKPHVT